MPSGTTPATSSDEDVQSLLASEDGVPARLELDAEAHQAAEPAPAAQRRPLKPRAEQADQHRRDDRLEHRPAGQSPDAGAQHDGHDRQRLGDHLRADVGGDLPVVPHRPGEGDAPGPLQRRDRERKDHQRGYGPGPAEAEGDSGCREAHGERERELNAVHRSQLCTSRRLRAPDHSRAKAAVGEGAFPGAGRWTRGRRRRNLRAGGAARSTRLATKPTTRLMKLEQVRKKMPVSDRCLTSARGMLSASSSGDKRDSGATMASPSRRVQPARGAHWSLPKLRAPSERP